MTFYAKSSMVSAKIIIDRTAQACVLWGMSLLNETRLLAERYPGTIAELCQAADVSERWFYKFKAGKCSRLSIEHVQKLHDYLSAKKPRKRRT